MVPFWFCPSLFSTNRVPAKIFLFRFRPASSCSSIRYKRTTYLLSIARHQTTQSLLSTKSTMGFQIFSHNSKSTKTVTPESASATVIHSHFEDLITPVKKSLVLDLVKFLADPMRSTTISMLL